MQPAALVAGFATLGAPQAVDAFVPSAEPPTEEEQYAFQYKKYLHARMDERIFEYRELALELYIDKKSGAPRTEAMVEKEAKALRLGLAAVLMDGIRHDNGDGIRHERLDMFRESARIFSKHMNGVLSEDEYEDFQGRMRELDANGITEPLPLFNLTYYPSEVEPATDATFSAFLQYMAEKRETEIETLAKDNEALVIVSP